MQNLPQEIREQIFAHLCFKDCASLIRAAKWLSRDVFASCGRIDDSLPLNLPVSQLDFAFSAQTSENVIQNIVFKFTSLESLRLSGHSHLGNVLYDPHHQLRKLTYLEAYASPQDPAFSNSLPIAAPNLLQLKLFLNDSFISRVPRLSTLKILHLHEISQIQISLFRSLFQALTLLEEIRMTSLTSCDFDIGPLIPSLPASLKRLHLSTSNDHHNIDFALFNGCLESLSLSCAWFQLSNTNQATALQSLVLSGTTEHFGFLAPISTQLIDLKYNFQTFNDRIERALAFCSQAALWPNLRSLDLSNSRLRNIEYNELQRLEHLTKLNINYCRDVDHVGIVTTPRRLREFHAARIGYVPQKVWAQVFSSSGLYPSLIETLSLSFYPSETIVLKVLPKNLRELDIHFLPVRDAAFSYLPSRLERLKIDIDACSSDGYLALADSCPILRVLEIAVPIELTPEQSQRCKGIRQKVANQLRHVDYVQLVSECT